MTDECDVCGHETDGGKDGLCLDCRDDDSSLMLATGQPAKCLLCGRKWPLLLDAVQHRCDAI